MFCYFCLLHWLDYSTIQVCNIPLKGTLQASSSGFLKMQRKAWFLGKQHHLSPDDGWLDAASRTSELEWCPNVVNDGLVPQPSSPILQYRWLQGLHGKLFLCQKWMSLHNSTVCYKMACVIHHNESLHPKKSSNCRNHWSFSFKPLLPWDKASLLEAAFLTLQISIPILKMWLLQEKLRVYILERGKLQRAEALKRLVKISKQNFQHIITMRG